VPVDDAKFISASTTAVSLRSPRLINGAPFFLELTDAVSYVVDDRLAIPFSCSSQPARFFPHPAPGGSAFTSADFWSAFSPCFSPLCLPTFPAISPLPQPPQAAPACSSNCTIQRDSAVRGIQRDHPSSVGADRQTPATCVTDFTNAVAASIAAPALARSEDSSNSRKLRPAAYGLESVWPSIAMVLVSLPSSAAKCLRSLRHQC